MKGRVRSLEACVLHAQNVAKFKAKAILISILRQIGAFSDRSKNITHHAGDRLLFNNFSLRVMRGDRIGLLGPNGIGKVLIKYFIRKISTRKRQRRTGH